MNKNLEFYLEKKTADNIDKEIFEQVRANWDKVSKPLDSMGCFEDITSKIGAIQGRTLPQATKGIILVFGADNGVVSRGVTQADETITALCVSDIADGKKSVNAMARCHGIDVRVIDVGVKLPFGSDKVINKKVRPGSRDFLTERAMTREEAIKAMQAGFEAVRECSAEGFDIVGIGEMGIGNTTTASAITAALLMLDARDTTGRGAGLSNEGLERKIAVIDEAINKYSLYGADTMTVLCSVGGYDIAAMAGACIGGMAFNMPIVLDGFISNVAALVADRLVRGTREYMIASHRSKEKAANMILDELKLCPVIDAQMALGEGTGAVMMISLIRTAISVLSECLSFEAACMDAYTHFDEA